MTIFFTINYEIFKTQIQFRHFKLMSRHMCQVPFQYKILIILTSVDFHWPIGVILTHADFRLRIGFILTSADFRLRIDFILTPGDFHGSYLIETDRLLKQSKIIMHLMYVMF